MNSVGVTGDFTYDMSNEGFITYKMKYWKDDGGYYKYDNYWQYSISNDGNTLTLNEKKYKRKK